MFKQAYEPRRHKGLSAKLCHCFDNVSRHVDESPRCRRDPFAHDTTKCHRGCANIHRNMYTLGWVGVTGERKRGRCGTIPNNTKKITIEHIFKRCKDSKGAHVQFSDTKHWVIVLDSSLDIQHRSVEKSTNRINTLRIKKAKYWFH